MQTLKIESLLSVEDMRVIGFGSIQPTIEMTARLMPQKRRSPDNPKVAISIPLPVEVERWLLDILEKQAAMVIAKKENEPTEGGGRYA